MALAQPEDRPAPRLRMSAERSRQARAGGSEQLQKIRKESPWTVAGSFKPLAAHQKC